ncbi:hypothetical protein ACHAW5_004768 [Stephanodiscus triporus]|uniref:Uncharacterized protein n=1 Tax=Stephanodiscus triporus TaxID=2934178 RepID=A0ABD3Q5W4_9STRA
MEEPPKIERIISSRGVSLSDTASLLKSFLFNIDQYQGHYGEGDDFGSAYGESRQEESTYENIDLGKGHRKSWQEREEEALIAQMDKLANGNSTLGISDDVLERLRMITKSICAEVEGKPLSASGMMTAVSRKDGADATHEFKRNDDLIAESEEAEDSAREERRHQQQRREEKGADKTNRDRKKEKKAKKAAKKAKKDAKRKAKELENIQETNYSKRLKVENFN